MKNNLLKEIKAIWREYEEHYVLCRIISILYQKIFQFDIDVRAAAVADNLVVVPSADVPLKHLNNDYIKRVNIYILPFFNKLIEHKSG